MSPPLEEQYDFVVVGSGGGSMCAALVMRKAGKRVLIVEKTELVGGTTSKSGGVMWIPDNRFMAEDGVPDSPSLAMRYLEATAGAADDAPGSTPERRRTYVTEAPRMVDFLIGQDIKLRRSKYWPDYHDERDGGSEQGRTVMALPFDMNELGEWKSKLRPNFMPVPADPEELNAVSNTGSFWKSKTAMVKVGLHLVKDRLLGRAMTVAGGALQGRMLKASLAAGVDIRTCCAVKDFIIQDGVVTGVVVETGGRTVRIGATLGVLVNAGGFAQNQAMRDQFAPGTSTLYTAAAPGDTGEMIQAMIAAGAAIGQMNERVGLQMSVLPGNENLDGGGVNLLTMSGQKNTSSPHSIVVDQSGVRYMNEAGSYMTFCQNVLKRNEIVPAIPSWWIFDQVHVDRYMVYGTMPGKKPDAWFDSGFVKRAASIEGLAGQIGIAPDTLKATVERFNVGARVGRDPDFHRGERAYDRWLGDPYDKRSATLGPIEKAPFYAAPMMAGDVGTYGGVVTDAKARVLREDGTPIAGLYATGTSTASVMGRSYPGAGSSVGPSFVWGFVAAKHAADADNIVGAA